MLTSRRELGSVGTSHTDKLEVAVLIRGVVLECREHDGDNSIGSAVKDDSSFFGALRRPRTPGYLKGPRSRGQFRLI